jgi:hypothetical protein
VTISSFLLCEYACRKQMLQRFEYRAERTIENAPLYERYDFIQRDLQIKENKEKVNKYGTKQDANVR